MKFTDNAKPDTSPWGALTALSLENCATGIWRVDTARGGGYYLSAERRAAMPAAVRHFKNQVQRDQGGTGQWFDEVNDWALVCLAFPKDFLRKYPTDGRENVLKMAINTCRAWHCHDRAVNEWLNQAEFEPA